MMNLNNKQRLSLGILPRSISLKISLDIGCNAKCVMCDDHYYKKNNFNYRELDRLIGFLDATMIKKIDLIGGEPLVDKDNLLKIIKKIRKKGIDTTFTTNGVLLNKKTLDKMTSYGINEITISLDAAGKKHDMLRGIPGLFNKINSIADHCNQNHRNFKINLNTIIMKNNIDSIPRLVLWAQKMNINSISLLRLVRYNNAYESLRVNNRDIIGLLFKLIKLRSCFIFKKPLAMKNDGIKGWSYLTHRLIVNDKGQVTPCWKKEDRGFFIDRPLKKLYLDKNFRNYLLDKINNCGDNCPNCLIVSLIRPLNYVK